jgi:hypothetical protein
VTVRTASGRAVPVERQEHRHEHRQEHRAPRDCPVCGTELTTTRLSCGSCGTEVSGSFATCAYCGLDEAQREVLRVFLVSRGNIKELERHLGVSYPTARQRFAEVLAALGFEQADPAGPPRASREEVLARLAAGELSVDEAAGLLAAS